MKIHIDQVKLYRGDFQITQTVDLLVSNGEALVIRGDNGVGKTTLLRAIAGLFSSYSGHISIIQSEDQLVKYIYNQVNELTHYIGHKNAFKSELTVKENLEFWQNFVMQCEIEGKNAASLKGMAEKDALHAFGVGHVYDLPFGYLSEGQKRRVALSRLLLVHRPIWLLDEPNTALDQKSSEFCNQITYSLLDEKCKSPW